MDVETTDHPGDPPARLVHAEQLRHDVARRPPAVAGAGERGLGHGVVEHAGAHRVPLGVIGVEQAVRGRPVDHLGQLPGEVHGILDTGVESLTTGRRVDVGGVAGQQDPAVA